MQRAVLTACLVAGTAAVASSAAHEAAHWSYSGPGGPSHWGALQPGYQACATGRSQSPINIRSDAIRRQKLPALQFDYRPTPLHIVDNGHTVQLNVERGSYLLVGAERYELVQFHFHHPGEERADGKAFDMVAHLVHRDSKGQLAV